MSGIRRKVMRDGKKDRSLTNALDEDDESPTVKRARVSVETVAGIETQQAQPDTSLEVDHMILDYIAYQTIEACFTSRGLDGRSGTSKSLSSSLALSESCLSNFKARNPTYRPDPELRLRLLLLRLVILYTQRLTSNPTTPAPSSMRRPSLKNGQPAFQQTGNTNHLPSASLDTVVLENNLPVSDDALGRNRARVLEQLGVPAEDENYGDIFYGTSASMSLLNLLPSFMQVSAARNAMSTSNITERWMHMACEFMLQACLEQFLVRGASVTGVIDECFSWGYRAVPHDLMDMDMDFDVVVGQEQGDEVNAMFEDEDYAVEVEEWASIKAHYLQRLVPASTTDGPTSSLATERTREEHEDVDIVSHLEDLAAAHPIAVFETSILSFLDAISRSITVPVLVQLESGKLDGMTEQETKDFLADCGFGLASFFATL